MSASSAATGAVKSLDWTAILAKCSPVARKHITDLRAHHEELRRLILEAQSVAASPNMRLDFDNYRKRLAGTQYEPAIRELQSKYQSFQPAPKDTSAALKALEAERQSKVC